MLVKDVLAFITDCKKETLKSVDSELLSGLYDHFSKKNPDDFLNVEDIALIVDTYKRRWQADSDRDYTLYPDGINKKWVDFAIRFTQALAKDSNKHLAQQFSNDLVKDCSKDLPAAIDKRYPYLLIPVAVNSVDYNTFTPLTDTVHLENLYLGHDGVTLYRKRSLFDRLSRNQFKLSTCRDLKKTVVGPMTIEELARFKLCKATTGAFSVKFDTSSPEEHFKSFWDFISRKVLVSYNPHKDLPNAVVPFFVELIALIDHYFALKRTKGDFKQFKKSLALFKSALYQLKPEEVNYFYGITVLDQTSKDYLLEYLIAMHVAEDFDIDVQLISLASYLHRFNPHLKCTDESIISLYIENQSEMVSNSNHSSSSSHSSPTILDRKTSVHPCWNLLISLFSIQFTSFNTVDGVGTITLWDRTNKVPKIASDIFDELYGFVVRNQPDQMEAKYNDILTRIVRPILDENKFVDTSTRASKKIDWLRNTYQGTLEQMNVYFFAPEVFMQVLFKYDSTNSQANNSIKVFLDKLINTYVQKVNDTYKAFRANVLFAEFLKTNELDPQLIRKLIMLFKIQSVAYAKRNFNENCIEYVKSRLVEKGFFEKTTAQQFLDCMNFREEYESLSQSSSTLGLSEIINVFSSKLHTMTKVWEAKAISSMTAYLMTLKRGILLPEEKQDATQNAALQTNQYFGQWN